MPFLAAVKGFIGWSEISNNDVILRSDGGTVKKAQKMLSTLKCITPQYYLTQMGGIEVFTGQYIFWHFFPVFLI